MVFVANCVAALLVDSSLMSVHWRQQCLQICMEKESAPLGLLPTAVQVSSQLGLWQSIHPRRRHVMVVCALQSAGRHLVIFLQQSWFQSSAELHTKRELGWALEVIARGGH
jgi:hypothetical protein